MSADSVLVSNILSVVAAKRRELCRRECENACAWTTEEQKENHVCTPEIRYSTDPTYLYDQAFLSVLPQIKKIIRYTLVFREVGYDMTLTLLGPSPSGLIQQHDVSSTT